MGLLKLLRKSIVFSTRSRRRFFTFVIVFAILSGATILLLSYFDNFARQELLTHRGVVLKATGFGTGPNIRLDAAETAIGQNVIGAEAVIYFKYVNFGTSLRIFSIDPKYPWAFSEIKPNNLVSGSFPNSDDEVMVSEDIFVALEDDEAGDDVYLFTKPVVGTKFKLGEDIDSTFDLKVSGIFEKPEASTVATDTTPTGTFFEWILMTEDAFDLLVSSNHLDYDNDEIYVHSVSILATGDFIQVFTGQTYDKVDTLASTYTNLSGFQAPTFTTKADKDETRNMMVLSLLFGLFGTFMVSTLYSYLITRFRRIEVAVLKAMGYSAWNVRIVVLSEILVVAITGYVIGLLAIQAYLYLVSQGSYFFLIVFSSTAIFSFLAVVISCVPGFFLITFRILGVRPIEIFRQK